MSINFQHSNHLEEIVFEEIPERFVLWDGPPRIVVDVKATEEADEQQRA